MFRRNARHHRTHKRPPHRLLMRRTHLAGSHLVARVSLSRVSCLPVSCLVSRISCLLPYLPRLPNISKRAANRDRCAFGSNDLQEDAGGRGGQFGINFVGADLQEGFEFCHRITRLFQPARHGAFHDTFTQLGHFNDSRHRSILPATWCVRLVAGQPSSLSNRDNAARPRW